MELFVLCCGYSTCTCFTVPAPFFFCITVAFFHLMWTSALLFFGPFFLFMLLVELAHFSCMNVTQQGPHRRHSGCKLNVHKTFRRRPGRLLNVLSTFNLHSVSTGWCSVSSSWTLFTFLVTERHSHHYVL